EEPRHTPCPRSHRRPEGTTRSRAAPESTARLRPRLRPGPPHARDRPETDMSKADALGGSATFDAVAQPMSSRAASFAAFAGQAPAPPAGPTAAHNETPRVPVDQLAPNPYNPRATLAAIEEMADSLTGKGIIQPLTVVTRDAFLAAH